ncbi:hypothetical protein E2C01_072235 [Portunus trituberculatus]|uniref:Uncharacterized protein n=1 Tax=Portunus trituberculatus TaxID=210409 RepID=A0A5B7I784_PORTR|nr:hypothetical protein [Portunus trituberculatus]
MGQPIMSKIFTASHHTNQWLR